VAREGGRVVLIEETRELQCRAPNPVGLRTKDGVATLCERVRGALRRRQAPIRGDALSCYLSAT